MELFKVMKYHVPISIFNMLQFSNRDTNYLLSLPKIHLSKSKTNFTFKASLLWNSLVGAVLNKCSPSNNGVIIPGSTENSDMSASIAMVKSKLKELLKNIQIIGDSEEWISDNFFGK